MSDYILLTKFWNERERIPSVVETVSMQTKKPIIWLLIDDGSTDGSGNIFKDLVDSIGIKPLLYSMPAKEKGNLDMVGHAYTRAIQRHKAEMAKEDPDYLAMLDVDSRLETDYFSRILNIMDSNGKLGCAAGQILGEESKSNSPRGSGKVIRWVIVKSIDRFWDLDADTFFNIKALKMGYSLKVVKDARIRAEPSAAFSKKGVYRLGRVGYYKGKHPLLMFQKTLTLLAKRYYSTEYLRGYFHEWLRGTWHCEDSDVRYYYSLEYRLWSKLRHIFGIGSHNWPD